MHEISSSKKQLTEEDLRLKAGNILKSFSAPHTIPTFPQIISDLSFRPKMKHLQELIAGRRLESLVLNRHNVKLG